MCNQDCAQTIRAGAAARAPGRARRGTLAAVAVWAWLLLLACLTPSALHAEPTAVRDIRVATHGEITRVVIDLNRRVSFRHLSLGEPPRLAIDLPEVAWDVPRLNGRRTVGLIKGLRFGRFRPGVSRIVLDVALPFEISKVFELPPGDGQGHRIVTDLVELRDPPPVAVNGVEVDWSEPLQRQAGLVVVPPPPKQAPVEPRRRVLVIDPGHGGIDPGAIGADGTYEKDIVLAMGLELRRQLEATGRYDVVMTRATDSIMRLRDRLQTARESNGDLFLSLHADSLVQAPEVRGASVYTLSEQASNEEAARLAGKENRADILAGIDLSDQEDIVTEILIDLAQRDANNKSIRLAELLVGELRQVGKMARQRRSQAGFVVLKSPDMPSALIELGYLSNAEDERALQDADHLEGLARAMVQAIDQYFDPGRS
jgi:N-acetylmuramoyl-L-alanine amidase